MVTRGGSEHTNLEVWVKHLTAIHLGETLRDFRKVEEDGREGQSQGNIFLLLFAINR